MSVSERELVLGESNPEQMQPELALMLIKRVFAAGLRVSALQALLSDPVLSGKAAAIVEELDLVIGDIRTALLESGL